MSLRLTLMRAGVCAGTAAALLAGGLPAVQAAAAPTFVRSTPAEGSSVRSAPTVSATFSLPLDASSTITLASGAGVPVLCPKSAAAADTVACAPAAPLLDGTYTATATVKDAASATTAQKAFSFTVDTAPPGTPTASAPGISTPNVKAVPVTGSAEQGATVEVTLTDSTGKKATGSGTAGASGYTVSVDASSLGDGAVGVSAVAVDAAGNRSQAGTATTTKDTTGPVLTGTSPADGGAAQPADAKGAPTPVTATYDALLTAATRMRVADSTGNDVSGTTSLSPDSRTVRFTPTAPLAEGAYIAHVVAVDAAGNATTSSFAFVLDGTKPGAPTVAPPAAVNAATAAAAPVSGTGEPGAGIAITVDDADPATPPVTSTGARVADDGSWSKPVDVRTLEDGTLSVVATATDAAGNTSAASTPVTAGKDTAAPAAPEFTLTPDPVTVSSEAAVTAKGTAEPSSLVTVTVDDADAGTAAVTRTAQTDDTGAWAVTGIDVSDLKDGTLTATARARDAVGNTGPAGTATTRKDATAPGAPVLGETGTITAANEAAYPVSGTAEPGSTLSLALSDGTATAKGTATAGSGGAWSSTLDATALEEGTAVLTVVASDSDGNPSPATTREVLKDTVAPSQPTVVVPGAVNAANKGAVPLGGQTTPGALVRLSIDDASAATAPVTTTVQAGTDGAWSATPDLSSLNEGTLTVSAFAEDAAGNRSGTGTASVVKDTVAPAAPSVTASPSTVTAAEQTAVAIGGTLAAGDVPADPSGWAVLVTVGDGTTDLGPFSATPAADGTWSLPPTDVSTLEDGTLTVTAVVRDEHANTGAARTTTLTKNATELAVVSTRPVDGAVTNDGASALTATHNEPLAATSTIALKNRLGNVVAGSQAFLDDRRTIAFTPSGTLTDGGSPYTLTVEAYDPVGQHVTTVLTFTVDTVEPGVPTLSLPTVVNAETAPAVPVSGTAEPSSSVTVAVTDGTATQKAVATTDANGDYSATVSVTELADGALQATAVATDAAGNASGPGTATATKDTAAPTVSTLTVGGPVNAARVAAVPVKGTTTGDATAVEVSATDGAKTVTADLVPDDAGAFGTAMDLSSLADGPVTVTAVATDAAANSSQAGKAGATKDTVAPAVGTLTATDPITSANRQAVKAGGTVDEAGSTVVVTVADGTGRVLTRSLATSDDGSFAATGFDLRTWPYGTVRVTAVATDAAGNSSAGKSTTSRNLSPIDEKHLALKSAGIDLGPAVSAERDVPGGRARTFTGGDIYWSPSTGARAVYGPILTTYRQLGGASSALGLPITDQIRSSDGRGQYNDFQRGSIYASSSTGAREIRGAIRDTWSKLGRERSVLGYPTTNELGTPDGRGRYNHFERGSVYWTPSTGAREVRGAIRDTWSRLGWERSALGYPVTDELGTPDGRGRYNHFERGSVYWTSTTGAHEVRGAIRGYWSSQGWERSWLGYPVTDEYAVPGGQAQDFQFGRVRWDAATGRVTAGPR